MTGTDKWNANHNICSLGQVRIVSRVLEQTRGRSEGMLIYRMVQKKIAQSLIHRHVQPFAVESRSFHQNAQKLTGNTMNGLEYSD